MKKQISLSYLDAVRQEIRRLEKKKKWLKYKVYLCLVLPVFLVVLAVRVLRTYLRLRVRETAAKIEPVPVQKEAAAMEFVRPEPAETEHFKPQIKETITEKA